MFRLLFSLAKGSFFLGCLLLLSIELRGQGCCPAPGTCSPCSGGISSLTLRYHGVFPAVVRVNDASANALFNDWVFPGQTFTVNGRGAGVFSGNFAYVWLNGLVVNATIKVNCTLAFDPFTYFGLFTIVSAESKNGGTLCCTSNSGSVSPPEIFGCPQDIAISTTTGCNAKATWTEPTAPACDVVSITGSHASGATFPLGVTQVTYTAKNSANLTSTCTFKVTVTDGTPPTVTATTPDVVVNAGNDCKATATWTAPVFTDNCSGATVTSTHTSGSVFSIGATTVTYTAKDVSGNTATSQFTVTVKDTTPPVVSECPGDITVQVATGCTATATWTPPKFTDGCTAVTVTSSSKPGDTFNAGANVVTYTAKDAAGNTAVCTFNVLIKDKTAPLFSSCPSDTTISTTATGGVRYSWIPPVATDVCSTPELSSTYKPGDQFPLGVTTVAYTAKDVSGNSSTCSFVVTVKQEHTKLDIAKLLTPDGNAINDGWIIGNIELYKENKVTVVDRWGSVVYSESGYDNETKVWRGRNTQGSVVPSGTYFYTITVRSGAESSETRGFIEVLR
ncbi:HYR domain-containing protein [Chryseolinea sp. T2]|uniref:HYR domain-containing protein n=1 Tax=Chryseolinea sp. T2 TaxID=3129255 RepID=UPI003077C0AD